MAPKPKEINLLNLPIWAAQTLGASLFFYRRRRRPIKISRLRGLLWPNLRRPIFLVGAARSGTTLLGNCLAVLPEISYHHEPVATKAAARYVYEGRWSTTRARRFYRLVYGWLMRIHLDGDLRFAEKTPRNCPIMDFLATAFPDAQFVHIIRDGRDVALSHSQRPWLQAREAPFRRYEPGGYPHGPYAQFWVEPERKEEFESTSDLHRCIWAWRRFTEQALKHGATLPASRYYELKYEDFVVRPQQQSIRLLDYLGISAAKSREEFAAAAGQARADSVGRWRTDLPDRNLQVIHQEAGELLRNLGYLE